MAIRNWTSGAGAIALAAALVGVAVQTVRLDAARGKAVRAAVVSDSIAAAGDTSRTLSYDRLLGDSLRAVQRRAFQAEQRSDELDRALGLERAAKVQLSTLVSGLKASVQSETVFVTNGDSVRRAVFDVREPPYAVHADVAIPEPPGPARIDLRVALDTLGLDVRIGCGSTRGEAVRPAFVTVVAPAWAFVRLGRVEQAVGVCSPLAVNAASGRRLVLRSLVERFGVSVGYAATRSSSGTVVAGPGVVAGIKVWP
jgi:hypothetical protein